MGLELSRIDLLELDADQVYFERFFLIFSDKIDAYRAHDMTVYRYVVSQLHIVLGLCRESLRFDFVQECCDSQGEYYSLEIISRLREQSDLVEWLCHEYGIQPVSPVIPLLLQHPVFYVEPSLELLLKNLERMTRWKKRYESILQTVDQHPDAFTQKFFFAYGCDSLAEKIKMIQ